MWPFENEADPYYDMTPLLIDINNIYRTPDLITNQPVVTCSILDNLLSFNSFNRNIEEIGEAER